MPSCNDEFEMPSSTGQEPSLWWHSAGVSAGSTSAEQCQEEINKVISKGLPFPMYSGHNRQQYLPPSLRVLEIPVFYKQK